jgi:hypothetical protein
MKGCMDNLGAESCLTSFGLAQTRYRPNIHEICNQIETK